MFIDLKCPFCKTDLTVGKNNLNYCITQKCSYLIRFIDNKSIINNTYYMGSFIIKNDYQKNITFIGELPFDWSHDFPIELPMFDWDYSSLENMKQQLKLILSFH